MQKEEACRVPNRLLEDMAVKEDVEEEPEAGVGNQEGMEEIWEGEMGSEGEV